MYLCFVKNVYVKKKIMMNTNFKMKNPTNILLLFVFLCMSALRVQAQDAKTQGHPTVTVSSEMFVQINGLDPYLYGDLVKAVRQRTDFTIESACVPANIVMFAITENNKVSLKDNFEAIKGLVLQVTTLSEVNLMVGYSEEVFLKKCQEFRKPRR